MQPNLQVSYGKAGKDYIFITVENVNDGKSVPSIFTSLTLDKERSSADQQLLGFFTENGFVLLPGESK